MRVAYGLPPSARIPEVEIPDLFRTEAPFVERNFRLDYIFTNQLQDPLADESQFFGELSYSFSERFGVIFASPYLLRDNELEDDESGFSDVETGARFVALGYDPEAIFKLAFGFNVIAPTGDEDRDLGEGMAVLEPEVLMLAKLTDNAFAQSQYAFGLPTESGETTEFEYNFGLGYVSTSLAESYFFAYPTPVLELNGFTGIGGEEAGTTILDLTPGLRWRVGGKTFAGVAASFPLTGPREFESQFIFSLIRQYGPEEAVTAAPTPSSRAVF